MAPRKVHGDLSIDHDLYQLIHDEITPNSGVSNDLLWQTLTKVIEEFGSQNKALLDKRDHFQQQIDQWHISHKDNFNFKEYKNFLLEIGYLIEKKAEFQVATENVDKELSSIAGPQLVVPVDNARYALNAANARWNSLYDALYRSNIILEVEGCKKTAQYNPVRGLHVIQYVRDFLDQVVPLSLGSHHYATSYQIRSRKLIIVMGDGSETELAWRECFVGYRGEEGNPSAILFKHHDLHIELLIGKGYYIGKGDLANIYDVRIESAISAIADCEDSVAAVDALDKVNVYRNWNGLMQGNLKATVRHENETIERGLNADPEYLSPRGESFTLPGRSLLFVRSVGSHMYTDAVKYKDQEIPESFLDSVVLVLSALHDLNGNSAFKNSKNGNIYIVKPKMHGPEEVALANQLFGAIETSFGLNKNTIKMGIMDEERRTSINLHQCIESAKDRVVFINTGFLDRTGDEIHTSMEAAAMMPRAEMKNAPWLLAYEDWNVDIGLSTGLRKHGQIGKGMWAAPDEMAAMMEQKIAHPRAGANTAWVPSPTAATLHAMHYHLVDVKARQRQLSGNAHAHVDDLLDIPAIDLNELKQSSIINEIENNAQGILGYVVRWINHGVGCSKVPDISDVDLMEDRATLRISSQYIANWLHHGLTNKQQVTEIFKKMAEIVDRQNNHDPHYQKMSDDFVNNIAFQAALDLVFKGRDLANGYTESILHSYRRQAKESAIT